MHQRDLAVLALYGLLTLVLTLPLFCIMDKALAGHSSDVYINPWADWWTKKALSEGLDFYRTDYMFYPQGTSLVFHSFSHTNTAISLLLAPLLGRLAAYNVTILLTYVLSGFGMYLLASYLTDCPPAAFVAGLIFAFCPYHMFESAHPVLVTTQWIPLFVMALVRIFRRRGGGSDIDCAATSRRCWAASRIKQPLLAAWWFLLTALSSWHLMTMLVGWITLYLLYNLFFEQSSWSPVVSRSLILLVLAASLSVAPFVWPIIREQLTEDTAYMAVDPEVGYGNDLASFFVPNQRHPLFSSRFTDIYRKIDFTAERPAYLGYTSLCLAIVGAITARRKTRFWLLTGLVFFVLSLGSRVTFNGTPLHAFSLPWAIPIIALLRHPFRLNIFLFFSLAVMASFGTRRLYGWITRRSKPLAYLSIAVTAGVILFEYLVFPFPITQPLPDSPFFSQLAQEDGEFAVADFPMGRKEAKYYLFNQTIHGKKMVDGVVSRTPANAYAFVDANLLLKAMSNENVPDLYIEERLAALAAQEVRYIIVHKRFLDSGEMENWQKWLIHFPSPFYEDDQVIVYRTTPALRTGLLKEEGVHRLDVRLGDHIYLRGYHLNSSSISAGDTLTVTLFWQSDGQLTEDYHVFVHLLDTEGRLVAQHDDVPIHGERPTWSWWDAEVIQDEHMFVIDLDLSSGAYVLSAGMYDFLTGVRLPAISSNNERLPQDHILFEDVQVMSP